MWKAKGVPSPTFWQCLLQRYLYRKDNGNQASPVSLSVEKITIHSDYSISKFLSLSVFLSTDIAYSFFTINVCLTCRIFYYCAKLREVPKSKNKTKKTIKQTNNEKQTNKKSPPRQSFFIFIYLFIY